MKTCSYPFFSRGDTQLIAGYTVRGTVQVQELMTGRQIPEIGVLGPQDGGSFSSDHLLIALPSNSRVEVLNLESSERVAIFDGHHSSITSTTFSPDDRLLASASQDSTVRIWTAGFGRNMDPIENPPAQVDDSIREMTVSPDEAIVAIVSRSPVSVSRISNATINVWDATIGRHLRSLSYLYSKKIAISGNNEMLASISRHYVCIWEINTGSLATEINLDEPTLATQRNRNFPAQVAVALAHRGDMAAFASRSQVAEIWDVQWNSRVVSLKGHGLHVIQALVFSRDGKTIASVSRDLTVRVWDPRLGSCVTTIATIATSLLEDCDAMISWSIALSWNNSLVAVGDPFGNCCVRSVTRDSDNKLFADFSLGGRRDLHLRFGQNDSHLSTQDGRLKLSREGLPPRPIGYGIGNSWITWNGSNVLWLPGEYRPRHSIVTGSKIWIGCGSGRVLLFEFAKDGSL